MKVFDTADLRNVGVVGHGDCGKTTLVSSLLFRAGAVARLGRVDEGTTVTDFDPEEVERKISIAAALAHAEWDGCKLNLIDTPGYAAFVHEARAALRIADIGLSVVCGVSGVEVQTEKTWRYAEEHGLPHVVVINKLDRERADFKRVLGQLQEKFGRAVMPVHLPIGQEAAFSGVVDLLALKAYRYAGDGAARGQEIPLPDDLKEEAVAARSGLMELVAEIDDGLMERFFEKGELSPEEFRAGLRRGVRERRLTPVLAASGLKGIGVDRLAEFIVQAVPAPGERGPMEGKDPKSGSLLRRDGKSSEPLSLFVFKTLADPFSGRISLFRVMSGSVKTDQTVQNHVRGGSEKLANLSIMQGKELIRAGELRAGDLGGIAKLKDTSTGDTLGDAASPIRYEAVAPPEGVISFAIEPKTRGDDDKLSNALVRLLEEDPALHTSRDPQTHEFLLSGTGLQHVEVALAKMKKKFGVDCTLKTPKVPYRETIKRKSEATARHKKQTGGHGQFAECKVFMEPLPRGSGYEFVDKIFGGSISHNYRPAVDKGIQDAAARGFLAGYPVSDFRVTLLDGKEHPVDSSELAFKIAGSLAFKECMQQASPTLLEPIMDVEVETPEEFMGDIMGDFNSRRGRVLGMENAGGAQVIKAQVPMAEMLTYSQTLKSITGGRGNFHMALSRYDEVPSHIQQKVIAEAQKARAATE